LREILVFSLTLFDHPFSRGEIKELFSDSLTHSLSLSPSLFLIPVIFQQCMLVYFSLQDRIPKVCQEGREKNVKEGKEVYVKGTQHSHHHTNRTQYEMFNKDKKRRFFLSFQRTQKDHLQEMSRKRPGFNPIKLS